MMILTLDFHTALRLDPDPKKPPVIFERGSIVEVPDELGKALILKGKAKRAGAAEAKGEGK